MELSLPTEQGIAQVVVEALRAQLAALPEGTQVRRADLEGPVEGAVREIGGRRLEAVVAELGTGSVGSDRPWPCGASQETDHDAPATWQTVLGTIRIRRAAYHGASCGAQPIPLDARLGLPTDRTSPLLRARLSRFCAVAPFAEACTLLEEASGARVSAKRAQVVGEDWGSRLEAHQATVQPGETEHAAEPAVARVYVGGDGVFSCPTEHDDQRALLWREAKVGVIALPRPASAPGHRAAQPAGAAGATDRRAGPGQFELRRAHGGLGRLRGEARAGGRAAGNRAGVGDR